MKIRHYFRERRRKRRELEARILREADEYADARYQKVLSETGDQKLAEQQRRCAGNEYLFKHFPPPSFRLMPSYTPQADLLDALAFAIILGGVSLVAFTKDVPVLSKIRGPFMDFLEIFSGFHNAAFYTITFAYCIYFFILKYNDGTLVQMKSATRIAIGVVGGLLILTASLAATQSLVSMPLAAFQ